jgi:hypothetical protein
VTRRKLILASTLLLGARDDAPLLWRWRYTAAGIAAAGTFATTRARDGDGFHQIIRITGTRNGVAISHLQPAGTAIPLNEPYAVDNLRATAPTLTTHGFGFALADGSYANPFGKNGRILEFSSEPATGRTSEAQVQFSVCIGRSRRCRPDTAPSHHHGLPDPIRLPGKGSLYSRTY